MLNCLAVVSLVLCLYIPDVECKGRYEIYLDLIEYPFGKKDKFMDYGTVRTKKYNHTAFVVDGDYEILQPLDDEISLAVTAYNKQSGQYKKFFDLKFEKFCTFLKEDKTFYPTIVKQSNMPKQSDIKCPAIPAGKYRVTNYIVEEGGYLPDYIPGSENWRTDIVVKRNGVVLGGLNVYAVLKVKNKILGH